MRTQRTVLRSSIILGCALMLVALAALLPDRAASSGLSRQEETHAEWLVTLYSASSQNLCAAGVPCTELCLVGINGTMATGQLCCGEGDASGHCPDPR